MPRVGELLSFTVGIEQILVDHGQHLDEHLPESNTLFPSDTPPELHLEQVVRTQNYEKALLAGLCPSIEQRNVLLPGQIRAQLAEVARELDARFRKAKTSEEREELKKALLVLEEDEELREVLSAYERLLVSI